MAKQPGAAEKKETPNTAAPAAAAGGQPGAGGAEHASHGPKHGGGSSGAKTKGHTPLPGACFAVGCKAHPTRFNFCEEHYDQFKFGLIKKTGELVSDHEKKIEHYQAYKARMKAAGSARKAA